MGRRKDRKRARQVVVNPGSTTPWWYEKQTFAPKASQDRRGESEFFSEFSTESLFSDDPSGNRLIDPYEILGLFPGASLAQVKKAHRNLAKQYHPDRFVSAPEPEQRRIADRMVRINAAYEELQARVERDET